MIGDEGPQRPPGARTRGSDEAFKGRLRARLGRAKARLGRMGIFVHANWYRDLWLFAITIVVGLTLQSAVSTSNQANRAADQARGAASRSAQLAVLIQDQRRSATYNNCSNQNTRHRRTLAALRRLYAQQATSEPGSLLQLFRLVGVPVSPSAAQGLVRFERAQAAGGYTQTAFLIDALAPKQNCVAVVAAAAGALPPTLGAKTHPGTPSSPGSR